MPGYAEQEKIRQEANPGLKTTGEVLGYALPVAGEVGLGGAAIKGVTAIPRALSTAARATGEAATGAVGKGALKRVLSGTVAGAVEGAGYNAGAQLAESAVQQDPFDARTAQKILFAGAEGAGVGGALGGTLGLLSHMGGKGKAALPAAEKAPIPVATEEPTGLLGRAKLAIQNKAAEAEVATELRSAGFRGSDIAKIGTPEELPRIANRIRTDIGREAGDSLYQIADKTKAARTAAGHELGTLVDDLDASGLAVSRNDVTTAFENKLKAMRGSGVPEDARVAAQIERKYLGEFKERTTAPYREREAMVVERANALQDEAAARIRAARAVDGFMGQFAYNRGARGTSGREQRRIARYSRPAQPSRRMSTMQPLLKLAHLIDRLNELVGEGMARITAGRYSGVLVDHESFSPTLRAPETSATVAVPNSTEKNRMESSEYLPSGR